MNMMLHTVFGRHKEVPLHAPPPAPQTTRRMFTEAEAAAYLSVTPAYLRQTRMKEPPPNLTPGPTFYKLGRKVRYKVEDLDRWLEARRVEPHRPDTTLPTSVARSIRKITQ